MQSVYCYRNQQKGETRIKGFAKRCPNGPWVFLGESEPHDSSGVKIVQFVQLYAWPKINHIKHEGHPDWLADRSSSPVQNVPWNIVYCNYDHW